MAITRKISATNKALVAPIDYVYGETAVDIVITVTDYTIPTGATAAVYASVAGGTVYTQAATISGNDITITPVSGLFQPGKNDMQVEITASGKKLITFAVTVNCENQLSENGSASASSVRTSAQIDADVSQIKEDIGALSDLTTTDKSSLVAAINEAAASGGTGGAGTTNYNALSNRPQINGVTLTGNKSSADLSLASATHTHMATQVSGLASVATSGSYNDLLNKPSVPAATTVTQTLTSGTEIGAVNGTKLYAPAGGGAGGLSLVSEKLIEVSDTTVTSYFDSFANFNPEKPAFISFLAYSDSTFTNRKVTLRMIVYGATDSGSMNYGAGSAWFSFGLVYFPHFGGTTSSGAYAKMISNGFTPKFEPVGIAFDSPRFTRLDGTSTTLQINYSSSGDISGIVHGFFVEAVTPHAGDKYFIQVYQ